MWIDVENTQVEPYIHMIIKQTHLVVENFLLNKFGEESYKYIFGYQ